MWVLTSCLSVFAELKLKAFSLWFQGWIWPAHQDRKVARLEATHLSCWALLLAHLRSIPGCAQLEAHAADDGAGVEGGLQQQLQHEQQQQHVVGLLGGDEAASSPPALAPGSQPLGLPPAGGRLLLQPRQAMQAAPLLPHPPTPALGPSQST